ncbi:MAG TPA: MerR family transcriptional regulator [Bacteroidales bacterium]|jgi:DNA-binding transcriptional MerR regulator|nr:MerR family transcriptional regulator [Bacteroidales bacterium]
MAGSGKKIEKMYYSIGEVARLFNVNTSLIRFWENEFDIIKPHRNKKGNRLFTRADVDNFHIIYNLVKERGFTLQGAKDKLKNNPQDSLDEFELIKTLKNVRDFLAEIREGLDKEAKLMLKKP